MQEGFADDFKALTDFAPFRWQERLYRRFMEVDPAQGKDLPSAIDLPTGLGKTSVMAIWLIALAHGAKLPRRLVYVVDRRTVVDQATDVALALRQSLECGKAPVVAQALAELAGEEKSVLAISTLRGEFADNGEWRENPARAAIIVGTVDMIGSRLLFSGYGVSRKMRPFHAGLIGHDSLIVHDEAHLSPAFGSLIASVAKIQKDGCEPRPLRVMDLSATQRGQVGESIFRLTEEEAGEQLVAARLRAKKRLKFLPPAEAAPEEQLSEAALRHDGDRVRVLVYVRSPKTATDVAARIRKAAGRESVAVLTGTIRGYERDQMTMPVVRPEEIADAVARRRAEIFRSFRAAPERSVPEATIYLVATSAGEVGVDLDADHMICDLATLDSMIQRLGRVNRLGREDKEFVAEIDVVAALPDKVKGEESTEAADREERLEATREVLQPADDAEDRDVSPLALRELIKGLTDGKRADCFSKEPVIVELTDVLLDGWAMTSVKDLPGRPLVERWLHGATTSEPPSTYVAWREEVDHLVRPIVPNQAGALSKLFDEHPILARERLRGNRRDVVDELKKIARRVGEDRSVILVPPQGEPLVEKLGDLVRKEAEDRLREATVVLPADVGGLDDAGMLDGGEDKPVRDVADALLLKRSERTDPLTPDRLRVLMTLDPETETWVAKLLGADATFEYVDQRFRGAARAVRGESELKGMRETARIALEIDEDAGITKALLLFARQGTIEAAESSQEAAGNKPVFLSDHNRDVSREAAKIAKRLGLPDFLQEALALAGAHHDPGKDRSGWQKAIGNPRPHVNADQWKPWAKSDRRGFDDSACGRYRHEFGSLRQALAEPTITGHVEGDLILHAIAAHHGWARPHFEEGHWDIEQGGFEENPAVAAETLRLFARLQRRFGHWGLAWLESLVRSADYRVSGGAAAGEE